LQQLLLCWPVVPVFRSGQAPLPVPVLVPLSAVLLLAIPSPASLVVPLSAVCSAQLAMLTMVIVAMTDIIAMISTTAMIVIVVMIAIMVIVIMIGLLSGATLRFSTIGAATATIELISSRNFTEKIYEI